MSYRHTQSAALHYLLLVIGLAMFAASWVAKGVPFAAVTFFAAGAVIILLALCFQELTIADEGDTLAIRYGPLPLFRKSFRYADITDVQVARSKLIDGLGIHYAPGRGWTYNLWGFDCVEVKHKGRTVRIGSDDADNLAQFLRERIAA